MVGKLFFQRRSDGRIAVCSAAVLQRSLILTAGHCTYDGEGFNRNFRFIPAYLYAS